MTKKTSVTNKKSHNASEAKLPISNGVKTILLIHGPNLNMLGLRDAKIYGRQTLNDIERLVAREAKTAGLSVRAFQSNHEGDLIEYLQENRNAAGIIINPGALTHYSYALHDALLDTALPAIEVHLSDIKKREAWRRKSVTASACRKMISGKNIQGYAEAVHVLIRTLKKV